MYIGIVIRFRYLIKGVVPIYTFLIPFLRKRIRRRQPKSRDVNSTDLSTTIQANKQYENVDVIAELGTDNANATCSSDDVNAFESTVRRAAEYGNQIFTT